jgi:carboxypeptidase Taq
MKTSFAPYQKLLKRTREIALLGGAADLLAWDQETYMPPKALAFRADQLAHLSGLTHRLFVADTVGGWIKACEDHRFAPGSIEAANVREWRRAYDRATKLPASLVEEFQRTRAHAREAWVAARAKSDFALFQPHLEKIVGLNRQMADCWGYQESRYDALLDAYEPDARASELRTLFSELRPAIVKVLGAAMRRMAKNPPPDLSGRYPVARQQAFNREVAEAIGFDFGAGRIDTTAHPFCTTPGAGDCRLTTRYNETDFAQSLYGILHEAGHGLYEQGLPAESHGTPCGTAASLGIHESQSRLWENHVGRSETFWEHWHGRACHHFPGLKKFSPAQISAAVNRVRPSFIRVEADQVTYDLHIILRFEIEVRLIEGSLSPADVPAVWNEAFEKSFGLKVPRDAEGCLQDVHWSHGSLGYFPTYTLGNLNASQLMRRAEKAVPGLAGALAKGDYAPLLKWLRENIHVHGHRHSPQKLMQLATGEPTRAQYHLDYLRRKFAG